MKEKKLLNFLLAVCLIIGLFCAGKYVFEEMFIRSGDENVSQGETVYFQNTQINKLSIDLSAANLTIKQGDVFSLNCDSKYITYTENADRLSITEKIHSLIKSGAPGNVVLYLPENVTISQFEIEIASGSITAEKISCDDFQLESGVGGVEIDSLFAGHKAQIESGVGALTIKDGKINELEMDAGVGNINIRAFLSGESEISGGIGKTEITLLGGEDLYSFDIEKATGEVKIAGNKVSEKKYGYGGNSVELNGNIGGISIDFE